MPSFMVYGLRKDTSQTQAIECNRKTLLSCIDALLVDNQVEKVIIKKKWVW